MTKWQAARMALAYLGLLMSTLMSLALGLVSLVALVAFLVSMVSHVTEPDAISFPLFWKGLLLFGLMQLFDRWTRIRIKELRGRYVR